MRPKPRNEKVLPNVHISNVETALPNIVNPYDDIVDPILTKLRQEREEPRWKTSRVEILEPSKPTP